MQRDAGTGERWGWGREGKRGGWLSVIIRVVNGNRFYEMSKCCSVGRGGTAVTPSPQPLHHPSLFPSYSILFHRSLFPSSTTLLHPSLFPSLVGSCWHLAICAASKILIELILSWFAGFSDCSRSQKSPSYHLYLCITLIIAHTYVHIHI